MFYGKQKKSQIEVQFNWVFILIVGAIILLFFIAVVDAQKKAADKKLAFDILGKIDLIISGALTIPKTGQIFDMPKIDFNLGCDRITALGIDKQFQDRIVFGPDLLKGRQMIVWSQDWNVPYKTANFLYMTTENVRYVIYYNTAKRSAEELFLALPDNITKEVINYRDFKNLGDKNNYKIKLIFFEDTPVSTITNNDFLPNFIKNMGDDSVSAVQLINYPNDAVRFFVKKGNKLQEFGYLPITIVGDPLKYGAVFSENRELFNCSYYKAFKRLLYVSQIYAEREKNLEMDYKDNPDCKSVSRAYSDILEIVEAANSTPPDIEKITNKMTIINNINRQVLEKSCAAVY